MATPRQLNFGAPIVLAPYGDSRVAHIHLKVDARQNLPVTITNVEIDNSQFAIQDNRCLDNPISPGSECVLSVSFTPNWWGPQRGTLTITSDSAERPVLTISLRGTGRKGRITLRPRSLNFGMVELGSSRDLTVTLMNMNPIPLPQPQLSVEGSGFSVSATTCDMGDLPANSSCMATIALAPQQAGRMSGSFQFDDSAAGSPHKVSLVGFAMGSASPTSTPTVTPTATPTAIPTPLPEANLYVANGFYASGDGACGGSVVAYTLGSSGDVSPLAPTPATRLCIPSALARDPVSGNLYIANENNNSVTVYASGASGNAPPIAAITGGKTGLSHPKGIALDSAGNIYVANSDVNTITVYAAGTDGDAAPTAVIAGSNTLLIAPQGLTLDAAGNLYVANNGTNSVNVFAPGSNGNIAPTATIIGYDTGLASPTGVALDSKHNIYVSNANGAVTVYPPGSGGNVSPKATLYFGDASAVSVGADDRIYVASSGDAIGVYTLGSNGNPNPLATISGSSTRLASPSGIAVDAGRTIYVANQGNAITVFPPGSNGNIAPTATLGQGFQGPAGIAVDPYGEIYLAEGGLIGSSLSGFVAFLPHGSNAAIFPPATLVGLSIRGPQAVAFDSNGNIYVATADIISVFAPGSTGSAAPVAQIQVPSSYRGPVAAIAVDARGYIYAVINSSPAYILIYLPGSNGRVTPIATISGTKTRLSMPMGIALDSSANMYVASGSWTTRPELLVFSAGSNGDVAPSAIIAGSATGLYSPMGVAVDSRGNIYVANAGTTNWVRGTDSITVYAPGSNGNVAPIATIAGSHTGLQAPRGIAVGP